MKKSKVKKSIKRKIAIGNEVLNILSIQIVVVCIFLSYYNSIIELLPEALYFAPIGSWLFIAISFVSVSFLIMSIGYSSISFFSNNFTNSHNKKRNLIIVILNEYRLQRSKVFFTHCFLMGCINALIVLNIRGVIDSNLL